MTDLLSILVNAVVLGSIYGLVAIGMTLIYGVLRVMDMSQGSMVMAGGFVAAGLMGEMGLPAVPTIIAAFGITFLLGVLTQLISSRVAPRFPIMWGMATLTIDVSISSSTAASVTAIAIRYLYLYLSSASACAMSPA